MRSFVAVGGRLATLVFAFALTACDGSAHGGNQSNRPADPPASDSSTGTAATATASARPVAPAPVAACSAPSLAVARPIDARTDEAIKKCVDVSTKDVRQAKRCGMDGPEPELDLRRYDTSVLPLDPATLAHVQAIAARGKEQQRRANVFALIGDSMTISGAYLRNFGMAPADDFRMAEPVRKSLQTPVAGNADATIIDFYRGVKAMRHLGTWRDSFTAPRAAKEGMRAEWALRYGVHSPLSTTVKRMSPAVAVVLFGGNDAAYTTGPIAKQVDDFERDLGAVIDALEERGVIPILNTLARHSDARGVPNCGSGPGMSDWRIAVQTNAMSARVAEMACARKLPLIDLRHAMDDAIAHGLSPDGIHPSSHQQGSMHMHARGMLCGYNIRNYVTLKMLKQIKEAALTQW